MCIRDRLGIMVQDLTREVREGFSRFESDMRERVERVEGRVSENEKLTKSISAWKENIYGGLKLTGVIAVPIFLAVMISILIPHAQ